jgi:glycosyltransferase involved in cell wall biosynthesis
MKRQKIVYIANANSIHDIKWISYFSEQKESFSCYLLCDTLCEISSQTRTELESKNICLLPQIAPFSITSPIKTWKAIRQFRKIIREIQPDLLHVLFAAPHSLWLNFTTKPSIITMRGSDILIVIPDLLKQSGLKKLYFAALYSMFRKAFLKAKVVTGTSWGQIDKAQELFAGANLELVRTGVDVKKINELDKPELIHEELMGKEFVFSPRFMSPIYNIEFQIEAISKLNSTIIERFTFVFIRGKQFDENYYQKQIQQLEQLKTEINLQFLIIDYLDQASIWMFLKKASLCIMTPISDGTPNSALESMAAKCPLIISNLNYDADLFEGTCLKLNTFEVGELSVFIEKALLDYPNLLLEKGFDRVTEFGNRENEMNKLQELYGNVTG